MNNENLTIHFKVKDFNAWQTSYNGNEKNRTSAGIAKSKVFRSTDDCCSSRMSPIYRRPALGTAQVK
jgi:hypothetical protein